MIVTNLLKRNIYVGKPNCPYCVEDELAIILHNIMNMFKPKKRIWIYDNYRSRSEDVRVIKNIFSKVGRDIPVPFFLMNRRASNGSAGRVFMYNYLKEYTKR